MVMHLAEGDPDYVLQHVVVGGYSRPRIAVALLSLMMLSLFINFVLYDSSVYSLERTVEAAAAAAEAVNDLLRAPALSNHPDSPIFSEAPRVKRLPQVIIFGVAKCGTRALLDMLALHPRVQKAGEEVHFFSRNENYLQGLEWYRSRMPYSFPDQITAEKSPSYFATPEAPQRVRAMNASIKLLLIVREPVTRAISDYTQLSAKAAASSQSLATIPKKPPRTFEQLAIRVDGSINLAYHPLVNSIYHIFLSRWLKVFQRSQILIVNGDVLIEDPVPQLRRIESFLGLEPRIGPHNFYFNHTKGFFCMRKEARESCLGETKGRRHPSVNPVVITKLRHFFRRHNQKFYDLVGEDMGWPKE